LTQTEYLDLINKRALYYRIQEEMKACKAEKEKCINEHRRDRENYLKETTRLQIENAKLRRLAKTYRSEHDATMRRLSEAELELSETKRQLSQNSSEFKNFANSTKSSEKRAKELERLLQEAR
jgi:choline kinase